MENDENNKKSFLELLDDKEFCDTLAEQTKKNIIDYLISNPDINISFIPDDIEREIYDLILSILIKFINK